MAFSDPVKAVTGYWCKCYAPFTDKGGGSFFYRHCYISIFFLLKKTNGLVSDFSGINDIITGGFFCYIGDN